MPEEDLARYDENIRRHLERINRYRPELITLRYFQHLGALYTEVFLDLDRLFNHKAQLLADLNAFVAERNARKLPGEPKDASFTEEDLTGLLAGYRQRQDPYLAPELLPVSALQPRASRQHSTHYPTKGFPNDTCKNWHCRAFQLGAST